MKHPGHEMLGKYSTISNTRPACTMLFRRAPHTYTKCVPIFVVGRQPQLMKQKHFLHNPAHPVRLSIGTPQSLPPCFHASRFKRITSIHCQPPLQKHVNNHTDNVNGVTFVTCKHMSPEGPVFSSPKGKMGCQ